MTPKYLKISEFSRLINNTLEDYVGESFFEGELQEVTVSSNGHLYCNIKDEVAALSIVMWSSAVKNTGFKIEKGLLVRCKGKPNVYAKTGRLQVVVSSMELAGEGILARRFEELKKKLSAEGLFDPERKRLLPFLPKSVGIVTSATGAVIHDIMVRLQARMPQLQVYLIDVRVQGEGSAQEIASAIKYFSDQKNVDLIVCARGGGSLQDLWSFNEELVVRAIFASQVPVVSAIGHEVDVTLSDLVADLRAPTPTAAAEMIVPNRADLLSNIAQFERRLSDTSRWLMPKYQEFDDLSSRLQRTMENKLHAYKLQTEIINTKLLSLSPQQLLSNQKARIAEIENRIKQQQLANISKLKFDLEQLTSRLQLASGFSALQQFSAEIARLEQKLLFNLSQKFSVFHNRLALIGGKLESLNPYNVMQRGFSVTIKNNKVISSSRQLSSGDDITVRFYDGQVSSTVK